VFWIIVAGVVLALVWRWSSHRWSLPCPSWLVPSPSRLARALDNPRLARLLFVDRTLDRIGLRSGQRVLEIGPGPGRLLIPAARRVQPDGEVVGLDIQSSMIARLQAGAKEAGVTNLVGIVGDAATTSPTGLFDVVILATALGEIPNRDATLRRCFDSLKPGGVLSITEMVPDPHFVSQSAVRRFAERAGFQHQRTEGSWLSFTANFNKPR
jgi:ubiquinone/menaquinone biosynthesis C-methylase UbiE